MTLKDISGLSDAELLKYRQRYQAQLINEDNVLLLDMTKNLLNDILTEINKRKLGE